MNDKMLSLKSNADRNREEMVQKLHDQRIQIEKSEDVAQIRDDRTLDTRLQEVKQFMADMKNPDNTENTVMLNKIIEKRNEKLYETIDYKLVEFGTKVESDFNKLFPFKKRVEMKLAELDTVNDQYEQLNNRLSRIAVEIQQKISNPKLDHLHM